MLEGMDAKKYLLAWINFINTYKPNEKRPLPTINIVLFGYSHQCGAIVRYINIKPTVKSDMIDCFHIYILFFLTTNTKRSTYL